MKTKILLLTFEIRKKSLNGIIKILLLSLGLTNTASAQMVTQNSQARTEQKGVRFPSVNLFIESKITYVIKSCINNTWGYDILVDNQLMIHQPTIPGMHGNEGFKTKGGTEKVAKLVISKMKKGEMPPTVTIDEMKKIKAI